jgi:hypothetical protein
LLFQLSLMRKTRLLANGFPSMQNVPGEPTERPVGVSMAPRICLIDPAALAIPAEFAP